MDIRGERTRLAIEAAFLQLLRQKPAGRITVTELCTLAGINRGTFYKHYLDVPDLQSKLEEAVLTELESYLASSDFSRNGVHRTMLMQMLHHMQRNSSRFCLLCSANAGSDLPARTFQLINDYAFPLMRRKMPGVDSEKVALLHQFLTRGCGAILVQWLRDESPMTPEELADYILMISGAAVSAIADSKGG